MFKITKIIHCMLLLTQITIIYKLIDLLEVGEDIMFLYEIF